MGHRAVQWLQKQVSSLFYAHGLFCSSHPFAIISLVITIVLITSYPLTTLPLPGNAPLQYSTPVKGYKVPPSGPAPEEEALDKMTPRWYVGPPVAYIMQFVVKSTVSPWPRKLMIPNDAFRGPLSKVFEILQHINNFQLWNGTSTLNQEDVCFHVFETVSEKKLRGLLPQFTCLTLSPANFWSTDKTRFQDDPEIVQTMTKRYGQPLDGPPSLKDILFGISWKDTGIGYLRNHQRVISYSVTVLFREYNQKYVTALKEHLQELHPLHLIANGSHGDSLVHIYFKDFNYFVEYTPLLFAYCVLFLYLYFSVRKIEMVKSKWGLAFSAVVTVVSSLLMSIGICTHFGLRPSLKGSEIFPYLVVVIGLENVLVVTKSVVSTDADLEVKLRVAKGLSKEGWFIFKNLVAELLVLAVGFFTFVPAIQEFTLFAVVGLLSDFFLQMVFFTTVLSIDIRRMELSDLQKRPLSDTVRDSSRRSTDPYNQYSVQTPSSHDVSMPLPRRAASLYDSTIDADMQLHPTSLKFSKSRRVRLMNVWARTRFIQRGIMLCVVMWIALVVYKTGLVEHLAEVALNNVSEDGRGRRAHSDSIFYQQAAQHHQDDYTRLGQRSGPQSDQSGRDSERYMNGLLTHTNMEQWNELSHMHWPTLLSYYNITMRGRYITILPSVYLSIIISPEEAIHLRHVQEPHPILEDDPQVTDLPPTKPEVEMPPYQPPHHGNMTVFNLTVVWERFVRKPQTKTELIMTILLGIASLILFTYFFTALYKCMCPRNYPKWRRDLSRKSHSNLTYIKQIRVALPLVLDAHIQEVECLVTDGPLVASVCLGGKICMWDSSSGELLTTIERKREPPYETRSPVLGSNINDSDQDLYAEYHGSPGGQPRCYTTPAGRGETATDPSLRSPSPGSYTTHTQSLPQISPQSSHQLAHPKGAQHARHKSADLTTQMSKLSLGLLRPSMNFSDTMPDLSATIDTDFVSKAAQLRSWSTDSMVRGGGDGGPSDLQREPLGDAGFDFSHFKKYYDEHQQLQEEKSAYLARRQKTEQVSQEDQEERTTEGGGRTRSWSHGDSPDTSGQDVSLYEPDGHETLAPAVWCVTCRDSLVVAGCGNGRIEFWDGLTGALKCVYSDSPVGVTAVCFVSNKVVAARLNGDLDFLQLETFVNVSRPATPCGSTSSFAYNRMMAAPVRRATNHSSFSAELKSWDDILQIKMIDRVRAHQQPINVLQTEGGRVVTASQDHTLKVFRVEDSLRLYTLHGHAGGVSALFLDKVAPLAAASGSEDGTVRLWDLMTGACVHKLQGHSATVTSLTCTSNYVISVSMDDKMCVWERCKGHLLHWFHMEPGYCNTVAMLTSKLMVTGGQGCLYLWNAAKGEVLQHVTLGENDRSIFVRNIKVIGNSTVVCDYGNQVQVIHFPAVLEKAD